MADGANREPTANAAQSETLCMCGNSMRENRETSKTPCRFGRKGRPEKAFRRTSGSHVFEESDDLIVPTKRTNKAGPTAAESVKGRGSARERSCSLTTSRTQSRTRRVAWRQDHGPLHRGLGASDPSEEPYEVVLHVRIERGATRKGGPYRDAQLSTGIRYDVTGTLSAGVRPGARARQLPPRRPDRPARQSPGALWPMRDRHERPTSTAADPGSQQHQADRGKPRRGYGPPPSCHPSAEEPAGRAAATTSSGAGRRGVWRRLRA